MLELECINYIYSAIEWNDDLILVWMYFKEGFVHCLSLFRKPLDIDLDMNITGRALTKVVR